MELAALSDPALVPHAVASVLGVRETSEQSMTETLVGRLRSRNLLLVLDNCEHLVEDCAALAEALLTACSGLRILATGREALRVAGETVWPVPSLSLPRTAGSTGVDAPPVGELNRSEAVRLFVERAPAAGQSVGLVHEIKPAADVVRELAEGGQRLIAQRLGALLQQAPTTI